MTDTRPKDTTLTRREFLKVAGAGAAAASLLGVAGCSPTELLPDQPDKAPTGGSDNMNVILVIIDTLRKDHIGAYGNDWIKTPSFDALAAQSLRFERAYPESLPTICARRAIHTGVRTFPFRDYEPVPGAPWVYGWQPIPEDQTTLAQVLKQNGYKSPMFITDTFHQWIPSMNFFRGFDLYQFVRGQTSDPYKPAWMAPQKNLENTMMKGGPGILARMRQYFANTVGRQTEKDWFAPQVFLGAADLLKAATEKEPFFMVVDGYDPHEPWDPPVKYVKLYDDELYPGPEPHQPAQGPSDYLTERELERMRAWYAAELTMVDHWLGNFLDKVEELGLFENTLIVLLGDHGHLLGEHGYVGKVDSAMYPELVEIPFLVRHPEGKGAGESSDHYASTHDVAPTILGFLGVEPEQPMDGVDLSVIFDGGQPPERNHFTLGYSEFVWARDEGYAMFGRNDGRRARLYDLANDPKMDEDVAAEHPEVVRRMFDEYVLGDAGGPLPTY